MALRGNIAGQAALLLAASVAAAWLAQATLPDRIPWTKDWSNLVANKAAESGVATIDTDAMKAIVAGSSHIILDARKASDFAEGHIPGSFSLPDADFDAQVASLLPLVTPSQPLAVYCSGKACDESISLAQKLHAQGITNVVVYVGGITDWTAAGLEVQR